MNSEHLLNEDAVEGLAHGLPLSSRLCLEEDNGKENMSPQRSSLLPQ